MIAAIGANIVYAIYPKIPLAFYEIGAGVLLSLVPIFNNFHIEPEVFMLIIIAPLMFNDGQSTDFHTLKKTLQFNLITCCGARTGDYFSRRAADSRDLVRIATHAVLRAGRNRYTNRCCSGLFHHNEHRRARTRHGVVGKRIAV